MAALLATDSTSTTDAEGRGAALRLEGPRRSRDEAAGAAHIDALFADLSEFARDMGDRSLALAVLYGTTPGAPRFIDRLHALSDAAKALARVVRKGTELDYDEPARVSPSPRDAVRAARLLCRASVELEALRDFA